MQYSRGVKSISGWLAVECIVSISKETDLTQPKNDRPIIYPMYDIDDL